MIAAISAKPMSSSRWESLWAVVMRNLPSDLEHEQALRTDHEQSDHDKQREHLRDGSGEKELEGGLGLGNRQCRCDRAKKALGAPENDDQEGVDDVELARGRSRRAN